jgi:hypothetical protein
MAWVVQTLPSGQLQLLARAEAVESSRISFEEPGEDRVVAAYHRAIMCASIDQPQQAEIGARRLNHDAPNWDQSHWILSRLLVESGRLDEAQQEAELALALVGDTEGQLREKISSYREALLLVQRKKKAPR